MISPARVRTVRQASRLARLMACAAGLACAGLVPARLAAVDRPSVLDRVKLASETLTGTAGFFRVGQDQNGRWWLVDPGGKPFLFRGVTSINRAGTTGGRRAQPGPYQDTVDRKYGPDAKPFVASVILRLRQWNFNALGAWATAEFFDQGLAYTEIIEFNKVGAPILGQGSNLPDVYDPEWLKAVDGKCRDLCTPRRDRKLLVGYFTDNELGWGQVREEAAEGGPRPRPEEVRLGLLQKCLSLEPARAAYTAAWDFVLDRHDHSLAKTGDAWGVPLPDRETVARASAAGQPLAGQGFAEDQEAFSREFARRYFQVCAEAIRKYDPHHLVLGCRFGGPPGAAILAECKRPWVDVLSANNYRVGMYDRVDIYHQAAHMPVLIGEFGWYSDLFPKNPAAATVRMGRASLEKGFSHPGLVGYAWYRWVSASPTGTNNLALQAGLVNTRDQTNLVQTQALSEINSRLEEIAVSASEALRKR